MMIIMPVLLGLAMVDGVLRGQLGTIGRGSATIARHFLRAGEREGMEALAQSGAAVGRQFDLGASATSRQFGGPGLEALELSGRGRIIGRATCYGADAAESLYRPGRIYLMADFGDDAAGALLRHGTIAEPLVGIFGKPAGKALAALNNRNARRLAILLSSREFSGLSIEQSRSLLAVIGNWGDHAMDFIWRHKVSLAVASVLTAFVAHPEPFLNGTRDLAGLALEKTLGPIVRAPAVLAENTLGRGLVINGNFWIPLAVATAFVAVIVTFWHRYRKRSLSWRGS